MHVALVSTYPPRACGLATFTQDLRDGLRKAHPDALADVVAMVRSLSGPERLPEVTYEIRQDVRADYAAAAEHLAGGSAEVICLQHEFGIFGGREGVYVLDFLDAARQPVVTTLHTVVPDPTERQRRLLQAVAARSARLVVLNRTAVTLLEEVYDVDPERVRVIPHGTPALPPPDRAALRERLGFAGRTVALTFGLLGPSKGIELALEALPTAVAAQPNLLYVVLGATHPEVRRREGERYRERLLDHVARRGLTEHVRFVDAYVDTPTLWGYLTAADFYVSPYPGMGQISSGTLAYALAAGLPVVSTPYLHAREVLADGAGLLAPADDPEAFGRAMAHFAADPNARAAAAAQARAWAAATAWPAVGARYAEVFAEAVAEPLPAEPLPTHPGALPACMDYLATLTDDTGLFQHADCGVPDRHHGYCTDDAARALVVALRFLERYPDAPHALRVARTCLSFVHAAQREDGSFHNFLSFDRRWLERQESQDTTGRALWGLGTAVALAPDEPMRLLARRLFDRTLPLPLTDAHALAYAACGMAAYLDRYPGQMAVRDHLDRTARRLVEAFEESADADWRWFRDAMTYGVGILPHALLRAYEHLGTDRYREVGLETLDFALQHTLTDGFFDPIGNRGWFRRGHAPARLDQQPIEAGYMAEACTWAWRLTGDARYAEAARAALAWFYGRNRLGRPVLDLASGACYDGFDARGVNLNQGAESTIACALAHLATEHLEEELPTRTGHAARGNPARSLPTPNGT